MTFNMKQSNVANCMTTHTHQVLRQKIPLRGEGWSNNTVEVFFETM